MAEVWIPRPDQRAVLDFTLPRERALVSAGVGVGKTAMGLQWLWQRMFWDLCTPRALVVCPPLVVEGWLAQADRWSQFNEMRGHMAVLSSADFDLCRQRDAGGQLVLAFDDKAATRRALLARRERITLVPWSMWEYLVQALGSRFPYTDVIFDESSTLRDRMSNRGRAARFVAHKVERVRGILELSATPAANHEEALYGQLDVLERGVLGENLTQFRDAFCEPDSRNWSTGQVFSWKVRDSMRAEYERRAATLMVSVPSNLGIPLLKVDHRLALPEPARVAYETLKRDKVLPGITVGDIAIERLKLRQIASGTVYRDDESVWNLHDAKLQLLRALVDEVDAPVIVAYEWTSELARLRATFGEHVRDIHEPGARAQFEAGKLRVLAIQPQAAAHGVDGLQAASHHVFWLTCTQDAELEEQLNGRLYRTGQAASTVYAHYLLAQGTVEEDVFDSKLPAKNARQDSLLRATRAPLLQEVAA